MARYFFDIANGASAPDDTGTECASIEDVRREAMQVLPDVARDEIRGDRDRRTFTVIARDEAGHAVYAASLSFVGLWLGKPEDKPAGSKDAG